MTYVLKELDSEPKAGNGQTSVQCYCRGFGPPKHSHRHFGWNVAGESNPVFLLPSNSHGLFPLCQPESNPPTHPADFINIIHYVQNLRSSTSWWHRKNFPTLSTNLDQAQSTKEIKGTECAHKNQTTSLSCSGMASEKFALSRPDTKRRRLFFFLHEFI